MHELPSGKRVSIDPEPLLSILRREDDPFACHRILALDTTEAIRKHIDLVFLVPAAEGAPAAGGLSLAEWDRLAEWSEPDRRSMREFLEGHAARSLAQWEHEVANVQERIRASGELSADWFDD